MGSRLKALKQACLGSPEDTMLSILQEWLQGKGLPVTWESLSRYSERERPPSSGKPDTDLKIVSSVTYIAI